MRNRTLVVITIVVSLLFILSCSKEPPSPTPSSTTASARTDGWAVRICKPKTEVGTIRLKIGIGGDAGSHTDWTTWTSNMNEIVQVPERFRHVREIWVRGEGDPSGRNVHMCVQYNDKTTQKMTFDNGEEHETSQGDSNDCDC